MKTSYPTYDPHAPAPRRAPQPAPVVRRSGPMGAADRVEAFKRLQAEAAAQDQLPASDRAE